MLLCRISRRTTTERMKEWEAFEHTRLWKTMAEFQHSSDKGSRYKDTKAVVTLAPLLEISFDVKHRTIPDLIRLKRKLEKKEVKIRAALMRIRQDMTIGILRAHTRHANYTIHDLFMAGLESKAINS